MDSAVGETGFRSSDSRGSGCECFTGYRAAESEWSQKNLIFLSRTDDGQ